MTINHSICILTTSLAEIRSFNPCSSGWRSILSARKPQCDEDYNIQFPLLECLESNSISDVCWLIGKRKKEVQICVRFARMCADSVKNENNYWSKKAAAADATEAAYAAAYAKAAVYASAAAAYAAYAKVAASAEAAAAYAAYAASAAYAAKAASKSYQKQEELNRQFLIQCINEYQSEQE